MENLRFSQELAFSRLLAFAYLRYFSRPAILLIYGAGLLNLGIILFSWYNRGTADTDWMPFWIMLMVFVVLPVMVYLSTRNLYDGNEMFQEEAHYDISGEGIRVEGEHFHVFFQWEGVYRVREYRQWMMISLTSVYAVYIDRHLLDETDWAILRALLRSIPELDVTLRG